MDIANSTRVNQLWTQINLLRQAIDLIDDGATIIAMTLYRPPVPVAESGRVPQPQPESEQGPEEALMPEIGCQRLELVLHRARHAMSTLRLLSRR